MKINNRVQTLLFCTAAVLLFTGCTNLFSQLQSAGRDNSNTVQSSAEYGSLCVVSGSTNTNSSRAVNKSVITNATVTVSGTGISSGSEPKAEHVALTSGAASGISITGIPVGKNRIITVQAESDSSGTKISGVIMRAVTDIETGDNTVTVNWTTTALGNIFCKLAEDNVSVSSISDTDRTAITNVISSSVSASLINTDSIASDYETGGSGGLKTAASYILTPSSLTFTYYQKDGFTAQVGDPDSESVSDCSAGSQITVENVVPGTWPLYILDKTGTVIESKSVTFESGKTTAAGTLPYNGILVVTEKASYPYIYYWDCSDSVAYADAVWPGVSMTEVGNYYEYAFTDANTVKCLVTDSGGNKLCSSDMSLSAKGIYIVTGSGSKYIEGTAESGGSSDDTDVVIYAAAGSTPSIWVWQPDGLKCSEKMGYTWDTQPLMTAAAGLNNNDGWYQFTVSSSYYTSGKPFSVILNKGSTTLTTSKTATFWYDGSAYYDKDPTIALVPEEPSLTITTDAASETDGTLALKRTITITLSDGNDTITAAPVTITCGSTTLSYTYSDFTDDVLAVPVSAVTTSAGKSVTVTASVTNSKGSATANAAYTTVENSDETAPTIQANKSTGITTESSISGINFTITDNNTAVTTAYYTTDGTTPTTSSTVYVSGDAASGLTGSSFTITETTRYKFLVVDAAGNETFKSFYYIFSSDSEDFRDETIYFVITTRFYDGDSSNNRYCWDGPTANKTNNDPEWRGDFKGLTEKLDYIKALGFSAIWITPPVENASGYDYHGYHAFDFSKIDDRYATSTETAEQSYQNFIDAAHEKGMKVIQDIVLNHTGNWGEANLFPMFAKGSDNGTKSPSMVELTESSDNKVSALEGGADMISSGTGYRNLTGSSQYSARINSMKEDTLDTDNIYHHEKSLSWSGYTVQTGQIAGDCVDLNTENPDVDEYLIKCYDKYIDMGVDAFRIDTCKHISRLMFNTYFNDAFKSEGGNNFYMFGEVCARYWGEWNEGIPAMSPCFYTWKDTTSYSTGTLALNSAAAAQNWTDYSSGFTPPVSAAKANYLLINNTYRTPDYTYQSGLNVIDFPMHWAYNSASSAFGVATSYDKDYCDPTWNVTYVDSHDYAPDGAPESERFAGYWPDKLNLLFTFRGIPCLYYGSEVEFKKGDVIDAGTTAALEDTGRAYYGDYLEGFVTASDFGEYTASGTVATTLSGTLAQHIIRLNKIRRSIAALRKGQYSTENCSGSIAFKRRYTDDSVDSFALVAINGQAVFSNLPAGTYIEVITGKTATVSEGGSITTDNISTGNMRVYVLDTSTCEVSGKIGSDGTYLY